MSQFETAICYGKEDTGSRDVRTSARKLRAGSSVYTLLFIQSRTSVSEGLSAIRPIQTVPHRLSWLILCPAYLTKHDTFMLFLLGLWLTQVLLY